ncbi:MAG TPA: hypothetical protein VGJ22_08125 [Anaerolineales bacterium]|jgi:hypothetical protein
MNRLVALILFRDREAAGLMPAVRPVHDLYGTEQIRYKTLCAGYDPALVVAGRAESGNFPELRILAWHPRNQAYVDLLTIGEFPPEPGSLAELIDQKTAGDKPPARGDIELPVPDATFADGYFAFADLDGDDCKELIVSRGWKAIDQRTRYFRLRGDAFKEVSPESALSRQFETVAEA